MRTDMLQQLEGVVRRAGDIVREAHDIERATMEKHGAADLVTKYDVAVQGFLQRELLALLPEADFLGEEGDHTALTRPWTFIVDPIDGTTNFVRRLHYSDISVALAQDGPDASTPWSTTPLPTSCSPLRRMAVRSATACPSGSVSGTWPTPCSSAAPPSTTAA